MRLLVFGFAGTLAVSQVADAKGAEPVRRFEIGASLGYAFPLGSSERGSRVSDVTFGVVPLELDGTYRLGKSVRVGVVARYAPAIPTLCTTFDDCMGSIGSDVAVAALSRFVLPSFGPLEPAASLGFGYEWFASRLADGGATSTRSYHGPLLVRLDVLAPFRLSSHWTLGPVIAAAVGTFTTGSLDTPAGATSMAVDERSVHAWLSVACRLAVSF